MKKALGALAILGAAAGTYFVYKFVREEDEDVDNKHIIYPHEMNNNKTEEAASNDDELGAEEMSEKILKNVEAQGFGTVEDEKVLKLNKESFPNLSDEDIEKINRDSEQLLDNLPTSDENEERPVQHKVKFTNDSEMDEFKNLVISEGYVVTDGDEGDLIVLHISKMDKNDILAKVFYIADVAKAHNGQYLGWSVK